MKIPKPNQSNLFCEIFPKNNIKEQKEIKKEKKLSSTQKPQENLIKGDDLLDMIDF